MKYFLGLFLVFSVTFPSFSQVGMHQWRMFPSPTLGVDIVYGNRTIYEALEKGLLEYDTETGEKTLWSATDYLSDVTLTALAFHTGTNSLLIGYDNGNIDLIQNETVYNLPYLLLSNNPGKKRINKIVIEENLAYLSTGLGVIVLDIAKKEIKDTYHPTLTQVEFLDVAFNDNQIYVLTNDGIFYANASNQFLADPSQWSVMLLPDYSAFGHYSGIEAFSGSLFLGFRNETFYNEDTIYRIFNGERTVFLGGDENYYSLKVQKDQLLICSEYHLRIYDSNLEEINSIFQASDMSFFRPRYACRANGNDYFMFDALKGLVKVEGNYREQLISFSGPLYNTAYRAKWVNNKLAIANGGFTGTSPKFSRDGGSTYENGQWSSIPLRGNSEFEDVVIWDFVSTAINPVNTSEVAFGTISPTPLVITNNNTVSQLFTMENSLIEDFGGTGWGFVRDMIYDDAGNLWILNAYANTPLKVLAKDGQWFEFALGNSISQKDGRQIVIDHKGVKWISSKDGGLVAFDEGKDLLDTSDDRYRHFTTGKNSGDLPSNTVETVAVDINNNIWIGTTEGMRVLYNTSGIFDASPGSYNFQKLLIEYGENVEIVLGTTHITSIKIDGGNRKWIGTASSGVFLISPDGLDVEANFTAENSPLLSNTIYDIAVDHTTGEVYFVTENGLISYRSDASQGDITYSDVKVFPNPVQPHYLGPITIQGIAYDSDVKITDVSGKLVYQTKSHGGTATWSGNTVDGERAATGVYLIWTSIDDHEFKGRKVGKVVLIR